MAVFPILCELDHSPKYLTLKEALEKPRSHRRQGPCMMAFFRISKSEKVGDMSSAARRRGFRKGIID